MALRAIGGAADRVNVQVYDPQYVVAVSVKDGARVRGRRPANAGMRAKRGFAELSKPREVARKRGEQQKAVEIGQQRTRAG